MAHPWSSDVAAINGTGTARVGPSTKLVEMKRGESSWTGVQTSPVELHRLSGLDRNLYAIARCVASEVGSKRPGEYLLGVAEGVRNEARRRKVEPYQLLVYGANASYAWTEGMYGRQSGRWAATSQDPHARAVLAARIAMDRETNLCRDTIRWCSLSVMDGGTQGGKPLRYDAAGIVKKWNAEGKVWIGAIPNVDTYRQCWFREGRPGEMLDELLAIVELGRNGQPTIGTDSPDASTRQVASAGAPAWLLAAGVAAFIV